MTEKKLTWMYSIKKDNDVNRLYSLELMNIPTLFQNSKLLLQPDSAVSDLKSLVSQTMNQLPEGHSEYKLAVSLVELVQTLL